MTRTSRNIREGHYVGRTIGKSLRMARHRLLCDLSWPPDCIPDVDLARLVLLRRRRLLRVRAAFADWFAAQRRDLVTGWETWSAMLAYAGRDAAMIAASRPVFDAWLAKARTIGDHWTLLDVWLAAAWHEH